MKQSIHPMENLVAAHRVLIRVLAAEKEVLTNMEVNKKLEDGYLTRAVNYRLSWC
jgi:hypothetical protein